MICFTIPNILISIARQTNILQSIIVNTKLWSNSFNSHWIGRFINRFVYECVNCHAPHSISKWNDGNQKKKEQAKSNFKTIIEKCSNGSIEKLEAIKLTACLRLFHRASNWPNCLIVITIRKDKTEQKHCKCRI